MNTQWCRYYNGIQHKVCEVGIAYQTVKDISVTPYRWICFDAEATVGCVYLSRYTQAEQDASEREFTESWATRMNHIRNGVCPECLRAMTEVQIGPCVYAHPCRHRLYQGKITTVNQ